MVSAFGLMCVRRRIVSEERSVTSVVLGSVTALCTYLLVCGGIIRVGERKTFCRQ